MTYTPDDRKDAYRRKHNLMWGDWAVLAGLIIAIALCFVLLYSYSK